MKISQIKGTKSLKMHFRNFMLFIGQFESGLSTEALLERMIFRNVKNTSSKSVGARVDDVLLGENV